MDITFDSFKNARNIEKKGLSFKSAEGFNFETAIYLENTRHDYGEVRRIAIGHLDQRLHVLCFVEAKSISGL